MTLWLYGDHAATARYDPATGDLLESDILPVGAHHRPEALPDGWYRRLGGILVVFYGAAGRVWLRIGEVTRACTSPACVDWVRQANGMARLTLVDAQGVIASVVYFGGDSSGIPPELDFTMTATEDFDFGEFVRRKLDDETNLRRIFGARLEYNARGSFEPPEAALDALPTPRREVDLGPLARMHPVDYLAMPNPAPFDDELREFLDGLEHAPTIERSTRTEPFPPVMPLALGLADREREVLQIFAARAAQRAVVDLDATRLSTAAVAAVLGGLDCDAASTSFQGARRAIMAVADAVVALGVAPEQVVVPPGRRVGPLGQVRLQMAMHSRLAT